MRHLSSLKEKLHKLRKRWRWRKKSIQHKLKPQFFPGKEICSLDELHLLAEDAVFVGFDCEFFLDLDAATEVGFAASTNILKTPAKPGPRTSLKTLVDDLHIKTLSLKINERYFERTAYIATCHHPHVRDPFFFGNEKYARIAKFQRRLFDIIESYRDGKKPLVLVGYEMAHDLKAMRRDFPTVAHLFSYWVDVRKIMISLVHSPRGRAPGVQTALRLLGYGPQDYGAKIRWRRYHNAGNDAVKHLALLHAIQDPDNIMLLRTGYTYGRGHTQIVHKYCRPPNFGGDMVLVEAADEQDLPKLLQSPALLASYLSRYVRPEVVGMEEVLSPSTAAARAQNTRRGTRSKAQRRARKSARIVAQCKGLAGVKHPDRDLTRGWALMPDVQSVEKLMGKMDNTVVQGHLIRLWRLPPYHLGVKKTHELKALEAEEATLPHILRDDVVRPKAKKKKRARIYQSNGGNLDGPNILRALDVDVQCESSAAKGGGDKTEPGSERLDFGECIPS